jgi:hypothetical protein
MSERNAFNTQAWAKDNFAGCPLGDERRTQRLIQVAQQIADRPAASLPHVGVDWAGVKGLYRLLERPEATLASVTAAHRGRVTKQRGRFLILSDTTHVNFGGRRKVEGSGSIGPGGGCGYLLHSGLLIDAQNDSLIGLAGQVSHVRTAKRGRQNASQRAKRWRESEMWIELFEQVGPPPADSQYIHVCDSAADNFEAFCTVQQLHCDFVIRVGRPHRRVITPEGRKIPLSEYTRELPEWGQYELRIPRGNGRRARTATLRVSAGALQLPLPRHRSPRMRDFNRSISLYVVVVEEIHPPRGVEPIRWVLLTTLPVESFEAAWEVIGFYENRWLVEEWHKALKTGCALEARQLQSVDRLLPLTGVLSVVAVLLVQLKTMARRAGDTPASEVAPSIWITMLTAKGKLHSDHPTIYEFWRGVAKLGGFLGRTGDGEPGWQTLWKGWMELHQLVDGARTLIKKYRNCG